MSNIRQELNTVSECERRLLEIALGVLRSDTDWARFPLLVAQRLRAASYLAQDAAAHG